MRIVDNTVGVAVCFLLTALDRVRRLFGRPKPSETPPRRVLVIKLLGLGTILMIPAFIRPLRSAWPGIRVDFLTFEHLKSAVALTGDVDAIHTISSRSALSFLGSTLRTILRLRAQRYDLIVDLDYFARFTMILSYLIGAPRRAGFHHPADAEAPLQYRGDLLTDTMSYSIHRQIVDMYLDGVKVITGLEPPACRPGVVLSESDEREAARLMEDAAIGAVRPFLLLNPNVSDFSAAARRWGADRFAELARRCVSELGAQVAVTGGPSDIEYVAGIVEAAGNSDRVFSIAGRTSLAGLAALSRHCDCMVSCDTGPMLLCSAAGAPIVVLHGPTAWTHKPLGPTDVVICKHLPCSPCLTVYNQKCAPCVHGANLCMQQISVDEVLEAVRRVLEGAGARAPR